MNIIDITPKREDIMRIIRFAAYCRVSSDSADQRHSFAAQVRYYSEYAKNNSGYELVDIYADEGLTGTDLERREEQLRLIEDCKKGLIDKIITKSVSRFARNTMELLEMLRLLKSIGVSVYFEEQGIDTEKLNSELIVTLPGMVAQKESETISGNVRWSIKKRMEAGSYNCTLTAYGFKRKNGELVVCEEEAKIIRRIFEMYLQGKSMLSIANILNEEEVPRRYGLSKWKITSVRYILNNERYMGDALLQKKYTTDTLPFRRKWNNGEQPQYYVENSNPSIISKEIYEKAQQLQTMRRYEQRAREPYPLRGKLRCPECGGLFRRQEIHGKAYWHCMKTASGVSECKRRRVREDVVYETFTNMLYKLKHYREEILGCLIKRMEFLHSRTNRNQEKIRQIDKEIANLTAKNLFVTRLHTNGSLGAGMYSMQTAELNKKITELRAQRKKLREEDEDEALENLKELNEIIEGYTPHSGYDEELFGQIIEKITVLSNKNIVFHLMGGLELGEEINEKGRCRSA